MISCEVKNLNLILMEPAVWILLILRLRFKKHSSRDGHWANDHMTNCKLSLLCNGNRFLRVKRKEAYEVKHFLDPKFWRFQSFSVIFLNITESKFHPFIRLLRFFKILKVLRFQQIFERLKAFLRFWLSFKSLWESVIVIADWLISDFIPKYAGIPYKILKISTHRIY